MPYSLTFALETVVAIIDMLEHNGNPEQIEYAEKLKSYVVASIEQAKKSGIVVFGES